LQQLARCFAKAKLQRLRVLQHFQHCQAILAGARRVKRVERIAEDVGVPELAFDASRRVIGLLIRRRRQPRDEQVVVLLLEQLCRLGQNIRETSGGHLDIEVFKELTDLWLAHVAAIFERHDQSSQTRTEVAMVAIGGQRSSVVLLLRRRVENVPLELSILWLDFDVLNDHDFILKSHGIGRQRVGIDWTFNRVVDREVFERTSVVCLGLLP